MIRQDFSRLSKRQRPDYRKTQFVEKPSNDLTYPHRLNFYAIPPTADITLEQFEQWAIDRLRGINFSFNAEVRLTIWQSSQNSKPVPLETRPRRRQKRT